jgi:hypothetical protein
VGTRGEKMYSSCSFFTTAWDGGEVVSIMPWPCFLLGKGPYGKHLTGGWVGLRASLGTEAWETYSTTARDQTLVFQSVVRHYTCRLGGVVVSVLATGPKGRGFEPSQGDGLLRAIKICSTPSFGWEVNMEDPCHKILWCVKDFLKSHRGWID